jgi:serine/threonine protein kinase
MGVVYAARDERLARTVALKTMSSLTADETARKRFWREARAAASVNHPNVCQLYEIGEDGGELFLVMELLEGEALTERLRQGALSLSDTLPIGLKCWLRFRCCTPEASSIEISSRPTCSSLPTA